MKHNPDHDRLLNDILEDAMPPGLRAAMLEKTLAAVRRRRRLQLAGRAAGAGALVCLGLALWKFSSPPSVPPVLPTLPIAASPPSNPLQIIHTDAGSVTVIDSDPGSVEWITDASSTEPVNVLDDQELLSLVAGKAVALVRTPSGRTELVFANPADAKGFPLR